MNDETLELKYEITETLDNFDLFLHKKQEILSSIYQTTFKMMFEKLCLVWFFLQDPSVLIDSKITVYTVEGSTMNLTFTIDPVMEFYSYRYGFTYIDSEANQYDIISRPNIIELQITNVTANDTGLYWVDYSDDLYSSVELSIQNMSCPYASTRFVCANKGSSTVLTFKIVVSVVYSPFEEGRLRREKRPLRNLTITVDLYIHNVTFEDRGFYDIYDFNERIALQVFRLYFINQTYLETIVGQEGESVEITCFSDTGQYITSLTLESNGTIKAIGDKQSVSFSFIPDRIDRLIKYKCVDSIHSSIMIEVELRIRYAPAVTIRYTNATIECDCDGVPPIYSMYRLDRISKYGELVYSVNLTNETFIFKTDQFPYQRNGRYMCVVSNGIPGTNGKEEQNSSIHVNYEGPPVFAKENIYVNHGKVGKSTIWMSLLVYSCPDVKEIFLQKLGRMRGKKRKLHKYVLKSTLLYNELDNKTGIPGYYILIESDDLDIEDFQAYIITVTNRLGASEYPFEIIKKEQREIDQREKKYVFTICIVAAVLFVSIIIHIVVCVNCARPMVPIHPNMNEDRTYHTYDEIGTISHGSVSNVRPSETHENLGQNMTPQHEATFSNTAYMQTTDNDSNALNADFPNDNLQQRGVTGVQEQHMSLSTNETNIIDDREQLRDQKSETSSDSDSESSLTVMVGHVGDGYANPYQTVLLDRPQSHQYTQITI